MFDYRVVRVARGFVDASLARGPMGALAAWASHCAGSRSSWGLAQSRSFWRRSCTGCSGPLTRSECLAGPPSPA
jgi:hypothetical protein